MFTIKNEQATRAVHPKTHILIQLMFADPLPQGLQPDVNIAFLETAHSQRELIKRLRHVDVKYPLRTEYHYNNVCYIVAGEAAAQVAGMPYEDVVRVKVINPLGLTNTGFSYQEMQTRPNYAMPYHAKTMEDAQQGKFIAGELDLSYQNGSAAGFIYSNVLDLTTWAKTMMHKGKLNGKQILNKESIKTIQTVHSIEAGNRGPDFGIVSAYGLGWGIDNYKGHTIYRHSQYLTLLLLCGIVSTSCSASFFFTMTYCSLLFKFQTK